MKNTNMSLSLERQAKKLEIAANKVKIESLNRILESVNMLVAMYCKKYVSKKGKGGG